MKRASANSAFILSDMIEELKNEQDKILEPHLEYIFDLGQGQYILSKDEHFRLHFLQRKIDHYYKYLFRKFEPVEEVIQDRGIKMIGYQTHKGLVELICE